MTLAYPLLLPVVAFNLERQSPPEGPIEGLNAKPALIPVVKQTYFDSRIAPDTFAVLLDLADGKTLEPRPTEAKVREKLHQDFNFALRRVEQTHGRIYNEPSTDYRPLSPVEVVDLPSLTKFIILWNKLGLENQPFSTSLTQPYNLTVGGSPILEGLNMLLGQRLDPIR